MFGFLKYLQSFIQSQSVKHSDTENESAQTSFSSFMPTPKTIKQYCGIADTFENFLRIQPQLSGEKRMICIPKEKLGGKDLKTFLQEISKKIQTKDFNIEQKNILKRLIEEIETTQSDGDKLFFADIDVSTLAQITKLFNTDEDKKKFEELELSSEHLKIADIFRFLKENQEGQLIPNMHEKQGEKIKKLFKEAEENKCNTESSGGKSKSLDTCPAIAQGIKELFGFNDNQSSEKEFFFHYIFMPQLNSSNIPSAIGNAKALFVQQKILELENPLEIVITAECHAKTNIEVNERECNITYHLENFTCSQDSPSDHVSQIPATSYQYSYNIQNQSLSINGKKAVENLLVFLDKELKSLIIQEIQLLHDLKQTNDLTFVAYDKNNKSIWTIQEENKGQVIKFYEERLMSIVNAYEQDNEKYQALFNLIIENENIFTEENSSKIQRLKNPIPKLAKQSTLPNKFERVQKEQQDDPASQISLKVSLQHRELTASSQINHSTFIDYLFGKIKELLIKENIEFKEELNSLSWQTNRFSQTLDNTIDVNERADSQSVEIRLSGNQNIDTIVNICEKQGYLVEEIVVNLGEEFFEAELSIDKIHDFLFTLQTIPASHKIIIKNPLTEEQQENIQKALARVSLDEKQTNVFHDLLGSLCQPTDISDDWEIISSSSKNSNDWETLSVSSFCPSLSEESDNDNQSKKYISTNSLTK